MTNYDQHFNLLETNACPVVRIPKAGRNVLREYSVQTEKQV